MINISEYIEYWISINLTPAQYEVLKNAGDDLWDLCGVNADLDDTTFQSGIFESETEAEELRAYLIDLLEGAE